MISLRIYCEKSIIIGNLLEPIGQISIGSDWLHITLAALIGHHRCILSPLSMSSHTHACVTYFWARPNQTCHFLDASLNFRRLVNQHNLVTLVTEQKYSSTFHRSRSHFIRSLLDWCSDIASWGDSGDRCGSTVGNLSQAQLHRWIIVNLWRTA